MPNWTNFSCQRQHSAKLLFPLLDRSSKLEDWQQEDLKGCTGLFRSLLRSPLQLIPLTALIHGSLISVPPSTALHPSKLSRPRTYLTGLTSLARCATVGMMPTRSSCGLC